MKEYIESQIDDLKQFVANLLPDYNEISPSEAAYIVLLYDKVFRPNHSLWLILAASMVAAFIIAGWGVIFYHTWVASYGYFLLSHFTPSVPRLVKKPLFLEIKKPTDFKLV